MLFTSVYASEIAEDYIDFATSYCISGNYKEALNYLDRLIKIEPNNTKAQEMRNELQDIANPFSKSYLTHNNTFFRQTMNAKKEGSKQKELDTLISAANSNNFWANYFLAEYYRENGDYQNAIKYYRKGLEIKPNFSQCGLGIAISQYEVKNYNEAITELNNYLKSNPKSDFALALRAKSNLGLSSYNNAEIDILAAIAINNDINYRFIEGKILYHRGNFSKAKNKLEPLVSEFKTSELYKYLGLCDYAMKDYTNALLNLDKAIILSDDDKSLITKYNEVRTQMSKN